MKSRTFGIALIIVGIMMLVYTGFNFVTTKRVVDIGAIKIDKEKTHHVQWPPIIGVVILISGVLVVASSAKKNFI